MLFPDMHLISGSGHEICCHRAVLCAVSPVFKAMLTGEFKEASHGEIIVQDGTSDDVRNFLEYVYTDYLNADLDHGALRRLLRMADMYGLVGLAELCAFRLLLRLDETNIPDAISALMPYHEAKGGLAKYSAVLVDLVQHDTKLLVSLLNWIRDAQMRWDPPFEPVATQDMEAASWAIAAQPSEPLATAACASTAVNTADTCEALVTCPPPVLQLEYHKHAEVKVIHLPLPPPGLGPAAAAQGVPLSIKVLCFNCCTESFSTALRESALAQQLTARGAELEPSWANGAKVFVENLLPESLEPALKVSSLRPWHVLIRSEDEGDVVEVINAAWRSGRFRSKRPRVRNAYTQNLKLQIGEGSSPPSEAVAKMHNNARASTYLESPGIDSQLVSRDAAGTVHYNVPPSLTLSPRSFATAP